MVKLILENDKLQGGEIEAFDFSFLQSNVFGNFHEWQGGSWQAKGVVLILNKISPHPLCKPSKET